MSTCHNRPRFEATPGILLLLAGLFYLDQGIGLLPWGLFACAVHELGHILTAVALKGRVRRLTLSVTGAELRFEYPRELSYGEESLVALAGPMANLLLGAVAYGTNTFLPAILSMGVGAFNLLPILPLDGGRVLYSLLVIWLPPPVPERILAVTAGVLVGLLMGAGCIIAVKYANFTLILTAGWLLLGTLKREK